MCSGAGKWHNGEQHPSRGGFIMNAIDRHSMILKTLAESGRVLISELSTELGVSEMTIRRDLDVLEQEGSLRRVHGGAVRTGSSSFEPPFSVRARENARAKQEI